MSIYLNQVAGGWQFVEAYQMEVNRALIITDSLKEAQQMYGPIEPRDQRTYFVKGYAFKNLQADTNSETTPLRFFLTKEAAEQQWQLLLESLSQQDHEAKVTHELSKAIQTVL